MNSLPARTRRNYLAEATVRRERAEARVQELLAENIDLRTQLLSLQGLLSERARIAAFESAKPKPPRQRSHGPKVAGVVSNVVPHMGAGRHGRAGTPNY